MKYKYINLKEIKMSKVEFIKKLDPRFAVLLPEDPKFVVKTPFTSYTIRYENSLNTSLASGTNYNINIPNNVVFVPEYEEVKVDVTVTALFTNSTGATIQAGIFFPENISPRDLPLNSATQSTQVSINGTSFVTTLPDKFKTMLHFSRNPEVDRIDLSTMVNQPDLQAFYFPNLDTNYKNPMSEYISSTYDINGRIGFATINSVDYSSKGVTNGSANTPYSSIISFTTREPVINDVFPLNSLRGNGFCGINTIQIVRTMLSNYSDRLISFSPLVKVAGVSLGAISTSAQLTANTNPIFCYTLCNTNLPLPKKTIYKAIDTSKSIQVNGNTPLTNPNGIIPPLTGLPPVQLRLTQIPSAVYVTMAMCQDSAKTSMHADASGWWIPDGGLTVDFADQGGQFSGMRQPEIYNEFCARQGFIHSFQETMSTLWSPSQGTTAVTSVSALPLFGQHLRFDSTIIQSGIKNGYAGMPFVSTLNINLLNVKSVTDVYTNGVAVNAYIPAPALGLTSVLQPAPAPNSSCYMYPIIGAYKYCFTGFAVNEYTFTIEEDGTVVRNSGLLDMSDIDALDRGTAYVVEQEPQLKGGSILSRFLDRAKDVAKFAIEHKDQIKQGYDYGKKLYEAHKKKGGSRRNRLRGGSIYGDDSDSEDEMTGGQVVSRSILKNRLL